MSGLLPDEQIRLILREYVSSNTEAYRWAAFCENSPRASMVGENLQRNPEDILKPPGVVDVWGRFLAAGTESAEACRQRIALRHIALFHKFGFETPVEREGQFIADMAAKADSTITWESFQSIVKGLRDRRILQGERTLFIVPKALHVFLWREFWEHHGTGFSLADLLIAMPESLRSWFVDMLSYAHESTSQKAAVAVNGLLEAAGTPI